MTTVNIKNGTYTVDHPERGHYTLKLHTAQRGNLAGQRILSLLIGPDNETSFSGVAFWNDARKVARVWKKHMGIGGADGLSVRIDGFHWLEEPGAMTVVEKKLCLWADLVIRGSTEEDHGYWYAEGYRLLLEARCVVCNRKLTEPESIKAGIGPNCRSKR